MVKIVGNLTTSNNKIDYVPTYIQCKEVSITRIAY